MKQRHSFNLIEILLAIGIIAVGLSSAMVLFTSGLRVNSDAAQSGILPDAVEVILSEVRRKVLKDAPEKGWSQEAAAWPSGTDASAWPAAGVELSSFPAADLSSDKTLIVNGDSILYRQLKVTGVNDSGVPNAWESGFSAIAEVRKIASPDDIIISNPREPQSQLLTRDPSTKKVRFPDAGDAVAGDPRLEKNDAQLNSRLVLEVRISYPAEVPMASRESQIYRLEIFNEKYNRFNP